jgi:hypothetical protein
MARQQQKKLAADTTGSAKSSGIPCAMAYGLYALSPGTGLSAPVVRIARNVAHLTSASGGQDHATSPSVLMPIVFGTDTSTASRRQRP